MSKESRPVYSRAVAALATRAASPSIASALFMSLVADIYNVSEADVRADVVKHWRYVQTQKRIAFRVPGPFGEDGGV